MYKKHRTVSRRSRYKQLVAECRTMISDYTSRTEERLLDSGNISNFYRYCNRSFSNYSAIGPLKTSSDDIVTDAQAKANLLQKSFSGCFTVDNGVVPPSPLRTTARICNIAFTHTSVRRCISKLRPKSKCGPDKIPSIFIKKCSLWLTEPLVYLFTQSFAVGFIPQIWKTAHISPIFKKGDPTNPSNYRPIALTCIFCKIMETIIKNEMLSYLSENNIISSKQHAFLKKCSTTTNLLECTREWSLALDCGKAVDIIYIDFERAFDSIVHSKLPLKLTSIGICDNLLRWIGCFISNRVQSVVVDNCVSDYCTVTSGIIQGSVLGPLLFIVFINDLTNIHYTILFYY